MKLWCFEDSRDWGINLVKAASARGHDAHLFDDPRKPDHGYVFYHMHHHPQTRGRDKRFMQILNMNPNLTLIPEYRSSRLFDDKMEQACELASWMPRTHVAWSPGAARSVLDRGLLSLPLVSKASEGASSNNVRLVRTLEEARLEIKHAFSDLGIKVHYGQKQHGYLLWQEFIPDNDWDLRVISIGNARLLLKRFNRAGVPFASGSGKFEAVTQIDATLDEAFCTANAFFAAQEMKWCGIDLVRSPSGDWKVLETTVGWTMHGYADCMFFKHDGEPMMRTGRDVWDVLIDQIEAGVFS